MIKTIRNIGLVSLLILFSLVSVVIASDEGLVGYWKFDEGEGNIAVDSNSYKNNGKIVEAVYVEGKDGHALKFDGTKGYVEIPDSDSLNITGAITLEMWVYLQELPEESKIYSFIQKGVNVTIRNSGCI